ncbi:MAG: GNAT family N-acetyltransferase [Gammaproteobacteria bacterium]|nr:GNAT family N-acetyltransferase [Gammaproteobacteria bacterium]
MQIDEANLANLTGLWKKYGSRRINGDTLPLQYANTHWPHRCWFDMNMDDLSYMIPEYLNDTAWLDKVPESMVIPVWPIIDNKEHGYTERLERLLIEKKWSLAFEQVAMYLALQDTAVYSPPIRHGFKVRPVCRPEDIKRWVDIGSEAFAYNIDYPVIENLYDNKDIKLLLGWQDEQAVTAALLYKTGDIIGIHQVGVKQAFQGQGIARCLMQYIMETCALWQGKYLVLQASQVGQPLYESLGFSMQFPIKNYQRLNQGVM